jgi:hypothetical protein
VYDKAPDDSRTPMVTAPDDLIFAKVSACAEATTPIPNNAATKRFFFMTAPSSLLKVIKQTQKNKNRIYSF